ncbi:MAG: energy transducer TonB [bacterium]|nr:energy transducer TonB [bacterium]
MEIAGSMGWKSFRFAGAIVAAVLLNAALLVAAAQMTSDRPLPQDMSEPQAVSLIKLKKAAPPPPEPEQEIVEPEEKPKLDFMPELSAPSLAGPDPLDIQISLDPSLFQGGPTKGDFIFNGDDLDQPPRQMIRTNPVYPYRARQRGIEGEVKVKLLVRADGTVANVEILESSPAGLFDSSVKKTVPQWKFTPGRIDGKAVPSWVVTNVVFVLNN